MHEEACIESSDLENLRDVWSIGIYSGDSPLRLFPHPKIRNPVLTNLDVTDIPARFVADPFMVREKNLWYMFFEVLNAGTERGAIGLAVSRDGLDWEYCRIVLEEPFHISYPYVFKWQGEYYLMPETLAPGCIRLYRAAPFPTRWSCVASLLDGHYADPSIVRFDGRWWVFACTPPGKNETLRLYHSDQLTGRWREHRRSPIIRGDPHIARPAGRITLWNDKLIRYAQDCHPIYGHHVQAFEITRLTMDDYREQAADESAVLSPGKDPWNNARMHHLDPHLTREGEWIACVDGRSMK